MANSFLWHQPKPHTPIDVDQIAKDFLTVHEHLSDHVHSIFKLKQKITSEQELRALEYDSLLNQKQLLMDQLKNAVFQTEQGRMWTSLKRFTANNANELVTREGCFLDALANQISLLDQEKKLTPIVKSMEVLHQSNAIVRVLRDLKLAFDDSQMTAGHILIESTELMDVSVTIAIEFEEVMQSNWIFLKLESGLFGDVICKTKYGSEIKEWGKKSIKQHLAFHASKDYFDRMELTFQLKQPLFEDDLYFWMIQLSSIELYQKQFIKEGKLVIGPYVQETLSEKLWIDASGTHLDQIHWYIAYRNDLPEEEDYQAIGFRTAYEREKTSRMLTVGTGTVQETDRNDFTILFNPMLYDFSNVNSFEVFYGIRQWKCEKTFVAFGNRQPTKALWDVLWKEQKDQIQVYHHSIYEPLPFLSKQEPMREGNCFRFQTQVYLNEEKTITWKNPLFNQKEDVLWTILINNQTILIQQSEYRFRLQKGWNELCIMVQFRSTEESATLDFDDLNLGHWVIPEIADARAIREAMKIRTFEEWNKESADQLKHSVYFSKQKWHVKFKYNDVRFGLHHLNYMGSKRESLWIKAVLSSNDQYDQTPIIESIEMREIR